jgi:hypothetical protein
MSPISTYTVARCAGLFRPRSWAAPRLQRILRVTLLLPLFFGSPLSSTSSEVTLRLIDAKSVKPLNGIAVHIFMWSGAFDPKHPPKTVSIDATTDELGQVVFRLPEPAPDNVAFTLSPEELWGCWSGDFSVVEVLRAGVVASYKSSCGKLKHQLSARPGEIIIFDKRLRVGDRVRRELP